MSTDKCLSLSNKSELHTVFIQKAKDLIAYINCAIIKWWWKMCNLFGMDERVENIEERLHIVEHELNKMYNINKLYESDEKVKKNDSTFYEDCEKLAILMKPRINNHTQIQYITGHDNVFDMRKDMYSQMENVYETFEKNVQNIIDHVNRELDTRGYNITQIGTDSVIVNGNYETVSRLVKSIVNN
ncbi:P38.7 [Phthorimaea operculella granulovirus]|uniref:p38.7 n=1 Tax=Phthorimaea operculella granulovirus TaxID=192584 RepID=Q8JRZ4_9BBAC|nr:P38.7 [Phthorimaea operculella granulovirus]AAM70263.1 P38.7 [Phthorimaea operculella granulovirus]ANY57454.1 P38.7 [Phthorimaea operculella granulovirus]QBH65900.1 P38.7 [Phthorimaea operculella granulovirus]QBH66030.1 P38.7 [Phthorimaea operculella granulovirus]QBH66160.1 P38.7 [Phthorimaea operculella granulovirus]